MAFELAVTLALVLANAFFVATEFAIARLRPTQVSELERASVTGAASVRHAVDHIDAYLAACQLGIPLASIGLGVAGKPFFHELLEPLLGGAAAVAGFAVAGALAFSIVTLLHVVVDELASKSRHRADRADGAPGRAANAAVLSSHAASRGSVQRNGKPAAQAVRRAPGARRRPSAAHGG
jgi:CBS domain containing-hemolysin-like protein